MIDEAYAAFLGIDLDQLPTDSAYGIGSEEVAVRHGRLRMNVCGRSLLVPVLFCPNQAPGLLGRDGVFEHFFLAFVHQHGALLAEEV
jgi:hypothetical protein